MMDLDRVWVTTVRIDSVDGIYVFPTDFCQVLVSVPVPTFSQVNEAQWYVSLSRARAAMFVFTDSLLALKEAVMRPSSFSTVAFHPE